MICLVTVPGTSTVDQVVDIIDRDGAVVVEDFFGPEDLAELQKQAAAALDCGMKGEEEFFGKQTRRVSRLFARMPKTADIALHPLYKNTAERILRKPVDIWLGRERREIFPDIHLSSTQLIEIQPGESAQALHRDDMSFLWRHPDYGREGRVQIMVAVSDFTEANGATRVIPGSNKWDDERGPLDEETVPAEMKAGSALFWVGSVYHGGGANTSRDDVRVGLTISYDMASLRPEENHLLSMTMDEVKRLPTEIQKMIGFSAGENFMGWIEVDGKLTDPFVLLEDNDAVINTVLP